MTDTIREDDLTDADRAVLAGEDVDPAEVAAAQARRTGLARIAGLRDLAARRKAATDAEQLDRDQAAAADQRAREALRGCMAADIVGPYDDAVAAVAALSDVLSRRNAALLRLAALPTGHRPRGASVDHAHGPRATRLVLDGVTHRWEDEGAVLRRAIESAGVSSKSLQPVDGDLFRIDRRDPGIVAEGRVEQLGGDAA